MKENKEEDFAQDTAIKLHLKKEIFYYYNKAIFFDSVKNNKMYVERLPDDAAQDETTNVDYYTSRGIFEADMGDLENALRDYETSLLIHPYIDSYHWAAMLAKAVGHKENACVYMQQWATLVPYPPTNGIESDVFKKREIANKFCIELGFEKYNTKDY